MWQGLDRFQTVIVDQWRGLSSDEKAVAMLLTLPVLFYFGKNSRSYLVNTISALLGAGVVVYLVFFLFNHI